MKRKCVCVCVSANAQLAAALDEQSGFGMHRSRLVYALRQSLERCVYVYVCVRVCVCVCVRTHKCVTNTWRRQTVRTSENY